MHAADYPLTTPTSLLRHYHARAQNGITSRMYCQLLLAAALVPVALGEYSYSYAARPTGAPTSKMQTPTASAAPTRTETYAPTRMTDAPSYAPTTESYIPTRSPTVTDVPTQTNSTCPPLVAVSPGRCPATAAGLTSCGAGGHQPGELCFVANATQCPGAPPNSCIVVFGARRRLRTDGVGTTVTVYEVALVAPVESPTCEAEVASGLKRALAAEADLANAIVAHNVTKEQLANATAARDQCKLALASGPTWPPSAAPTATLTPVPIATPTPAPTATAAPTTEFPPLNDTTIRTAVAAWLADPLTAVTMYGNISEWATGDVTDMSCLFSASDFNCVWYYNSGASSFDADITAWDTTSVTTMVNMFSGASAFNQPLDAWRVDKVTTMLMMFFRASAFNQPLNGWNGRLGKVTDVYWMFADASDFDQWLGWCLNASVVTGAYGVSDIFYGAGCTPDIFGFLPLCGVAQQYDDRGVTRGC